MSEHARKQIRAAAVTDLEGLPTTGAKVFNARIRPIQEKDMACLNVFLLDENSDWDAAGTMVRTGDLVVEGRVFGGDDLFDKLDAIAAEVESRIYGEIPALSSLLHNIGTPRTQVELAENQQGSERRVGIIRILFPVQYRTSQADPTAIV